MTELLEIRPEGARALLVLAHGAGAGMRHAFMEGLAAALAAQKIATLRFEFPYMAAGSKRTDSPAIATAAVAAAYREACAMAEGLPVFAGGKSFGARMTTTAESAGLLPGVRGLVAFGFPLHLAKKPGVTRAAHLRDGSAPLLLLQGDRDALCDLDLMRRVAAELPRATLVEIRGADHGFAVLKRSGRTDGDVLEELAAATRTFVEAQ